MLRSAEQLARSEGAFAACPQDKVTIGDWMRAAQRKLADAERTQNSSDTRMEAYYDAAFYLCLVVLNAEKWKMTSAAGHHQHTIEAACCAIGSGDGLHSRLRAVLHLRNQKYAGSARTAADVEAARKIFEELSTLTGAWLQQHHPSLLPAG